MSFDCEIFSPVFYFGVDVRKHPRSSDVKPPCDIFVAFRKSNESLEAIIAELYVVLASAKIKKHLR